MWDNFGKTFENSVGVRFISVTFESAIISFASQNNNSCIVQLTKKCIVCGRRQCDFKMLPIYVKYPVNIKVASSFSTLDFICKRIFHY